MQHPYLILHHATHQLRRATQTSCSMKTSNLSLCHSQVEVCPVELARKGGCQVDVLGHQPQQQVEGRVQRPAHTTAAAADSRTRQDQTGEEGGRIWKTDPHKGGCTSDARMSAPGTHVFLPALSRHGHCLLNAQQRSSTVEYRHISALYSTLQPGRYSSTRCGCCPSKMPMLCALVAALQGPPTCQRAAAAARR